MQLFQNFVLQYYLASVNKEAYANIFEVRGLNRLIYELYGLSEDDG